MGRKALHVLKKAFIAAITYRSEIWLWFVLDQIPIIVTMLVWISLMQSHDTIAGYDLPSMLLYYFLSSFLTGLTGTHFETWRVEEIRMGRIDFYLTRPMSYIWQVFWHDVGGKTFYLLTSLPGYAVLFWIVNQNFPLAQLQFTWLSSLQFLWLLLFAYGVDFSLAMLTVLMGFWFEGAEGLQHFKWITLSLLTGSMMPVAVMPTWLQTVIAYLPFRYMISVPIGIIQGTAQLQLSDLSWMVGYIAVFSLSIIWLWRQARYAYASAGG